MVPRVVSLYGAPALLLTAVVFLAVLLYTHPAVGATMSDTFAAVVAENVQLAVRHSRRVVGALLPPAARPHMKQFLAGLTSPALVAQGLRTIPGTITTTSTTTTTTNNNNMMLRVQDILAFPVEKFFYALGGMVAELLLLRLLVHPRRTRPFSSSSTSSSSCGFFTTHFGWWLLLLAVAVPNGVVEAGVVIALLARLPPETYTPAVVAGKLLQPYVAAALRSCPAVARFLHSPLWWRSSPQPVGRESQQQQGKGKGEGEEWLGSLVEVALWGSLALTVLLFLARWVCAEPAGCEGDVGGESDGESEEDVN
ncbi:uncharacterized protein TM35_000132680 [Trypanosoma theileri]|uniref:Uncharacterized protein n=1 Tax=Trypanosoma theileri TaxID=67003 RepID=A0A1X0NX32_9TRYP|nr:uncharacterized protein TM35_000132680 [Trypanosoma theileri]ORC89264.1 hypothetical protein TM35_000132680 [Trypanosoma theileri]